MSRDDFGLAWDGLGKGAVACSQGEVQCAIGRPGRMKFVLIEFLGEK